MKFRSPDKAIRCGGPKAPKGGNGPSKTVGVQATALNQRKPTQMAIPLHEDVVPEQLVAAVWRTGHGRCVHRRAGINRRSRP